MLKTVIPEVVYKNNISIIDIECHRWRSTTARLLAVL